MVKKKLIILIPVGVILTLLLYIIGFFGLQLFLISTIGFMEKIDEKHDKIDYKKNDKWHIDEDNFEEYALKFVDYYEDVFSGSGLEYETKMSICPDNYGHETILDYEVMCNNKYLFRIKIEPIGYFYLFLTSEVSYDEIVNIDDAYFHIIDQICKYSLYDYPFEVDTLLKIMESRSTAQNFIYKDVYYWNDDFYLVNELSMRAQTVKDEICKLEICIVGNASDENIW